MKLKLSFFLCVLCVVAYTPKANAKIKPELPVAQVKQELIVATASWKQFSPDDNSFSILMPDTSISKQTEKGSNYVSTFYTASTDKDAFLVGSADFTEDISGVNSEAIFDAFSQSFIGNDGQILNQTNISLGKYSGKEIDFKKSNITGKMRLFLVDQRLYCILFATPQPAANAQSDEYFDSFQLNSSK